jgi:uncharacterized protein (TIGR02996 family)
VTELDRSDDADEAGLLDAIVADPDAIDPRLVYADWLQARGDLRGELIVLEHRQASNPDDTGVRARIAELSESLTTALVPAELQRQVIGRWKLGFVDKLSLTRRDVIELTRYHADWFQRPELRLVRELSLTSSSTASLRAIFDTPLGRTVRRLDLGSIHTALTKNYGAILRLPLEHLFLRSASVPTVEGLDSLPLKSFGVQVAYQMTPALIEQILAREWSLTELDLQGSYSSADELARDLSPLFTGASFPDLRHLAVTGWFQAPTPIVEAIAMSPIGARLESLMLNWERFDDDAAAVFQRHREVLRRMRLIPYPELGLGQASLRLGVLLHYRLDRVADAIPHYLDRMRLAPSDSYAQHCLAIALRKVGRLEESLVAYDAIVARDGDRATAAVHNDRHFVLCDLGRDDEAIQSLERAVERNPSFANAWNNLGYERERKGDKDGALAAYRRALEIEAGNDYARRNLSKLLQTLGRAEEALQMHDDLLARIGEGPTSAILNGRHFVLCKLARFGEALQCLERAAVAEVADSSVWNNLGYERQRARDFAGALTAYRRSLDMTPTHEYASRNLVELYLDLDRVADALALAERHHAARPTDNKLTGSFGEALIANGRAVDAIRITSALLDDPKTTVRERPLIVRAIARRNADGNQEAARDDLETVVAITDCPAWVLLAWFAIGLVDRDAWRERIPDDAVSAVDICKRAQNGATAARAADAAVKVHDATIEDRLYGPEIAIVAALYHGARDVAHARIRGLVAELDERGPYAVDTWQVESMLFRIAARQLSAADRELVALVCDVTRARRPRGDLAARL